MEGPFNAIGAYTYATGVEVQVLAGVPVTTLVRDFAAGDTWIEVRSTLGFPPAGHIRVGPWAVYYASKTPTRFVDLTYTHLDTLSIQTLVVSRTRKIEPSTYNYFWGMPWEGNDYLIDLGV